MRNKRKKKQWNKSEAEHSLHDEVVLWNVYKQYLELLSATGHNNGEKVPFYTIDSPDAFKFMTGGGDINVRLDIQSVNHQHTILPSQNLSLI